MLLGIVKGTAVSTIKYPGIEGLKLLVVQPVNRKLEPVGGCAGSCGCRPGRTRGPMRDGTFP